MIERLRLASWTFGQPLVLSLRHPRSPVSDLFLWRRSDEWQTYFELTNLHSLYASSSPSVSQVRLCVFSKDGSVLLEKHIEVQPLSRDTLDISELLNDVDSCQYGTFAVFHPSTPNSICDKHSSLAERGYVRYRYNRSPLCSYVHGNLDAIAIDKHSRIQLIGGMSLRPRLYNPQLDIDPGYSYEIAIVNPTSRRQSVLFRVESPDGYVLKEERADLRSCGCNIFSINRNEAPGRIILKSHMVMARPMIFRMQARFADVFHG